MNAEQCKNLKGTMPTQQLTKRDTGEEDEQDAAKISSRPVSYYDNFKVSTPIQSYMTMSVGNLSEIDGATTTISQINNNNNNNRVCNAVSAGNVSNVQNSKITGAASAGNIGKVCRFEKTQQELGKAPSMANCLSTTVPVNLAASKIAGRHTPTRNSLRHSRMIVMHRTGNAAHKARPPLLRHRRMAQLLATLQTILGIFITCLALWLLLWAPNLPVTDNPYWSGMSLLLSGSFGICLLCCFKKEYPGMSPGCCLSATKVVSVFLTSLACVTCICASTAAIIHALRLGTLDCTPPQVLSTTCTCKPRNETSSSIISSNSTINYVDLNCSEVENLLSMILVLSSVCNVIGAVVSLAYCYLHWSTRESRTSYVQVRTNIVNPNSRHIYTPNNKR